MNIACQLYINGSIHSIAKLNGLIKTLSVQTFRISRNMRVLRLIAARGLHRVMAVDKKFSFRIPSSVIRENTQRIQANAKSDDDQKKIESKTCVAVK